MKMLDVTAVEFTCCIAMTIVFYIIAYLKYFLFNILLAIDVTFYLKLFIQSKN